jgi:hypothetical protein
MPQQRCLGTVDRKISEFAYKGYCNKQCDALFFLFVVNSDNLNPTNVCLAWLADLLCQFANVFTPKSKS